MSRIKDTFYRQNITFRFWTEKVKADIHCTCTVTLYSDLGFVTTEVDDIVLHPGKGHLLVPESHVAIDTDVWGTQKTCEIGSKKTNP